MGKLGPNTPNHVQKNTKVIYTEFSASHFTLNEVLLKCQGNLGVELYLVLGDLDYYGNLGKLDPSALIFLKFSDFIILTYRALNF